MAILALIKSKRVPSCHTNASLDREVRFNRDNASRDRKSKRRDVMCLCSYGSVHNAGVYLINVMFWVVLKCVCCGIGVFCCESFVCFPCPIVSWSAHSSVCESIRVDRVRF